MRIATLSLAFVALFGFPLAANAGGSLKDAPVPEARSACTGGAFSGSYVGVHAGFGELDNEISSEGGSISSDDGSFTIGVHSGYNVQCGRTLFGIESDTNWLGADAEYSCDDCEGTSFNSSIDWFGTLRGRLGLVHDDKVLIYVTAGLAYAKVDHELSAPALDFYQSDDDWQFGWTAGGGVEFMRDGQWSLRAEALYVDLGSESHSYSPECCSTETADWNDEFWVARLGLTYHFGRREAEYAAPLK